MSAPKDCDGVDVAIRWTVITVALAFCAACVVTLLALWTANEARAAAPLSGGMCTEFVNGEWREVKCPAPITHMKAREILAIAYGQFHGPRELFEDGPPPTRLVPQGWLQEKYCSTHCPAIRAVYDDEGVVYLDETLDFATLYAKSILLHEYVHYFQARTRGRLTDLHVTLSEYDFCVERVRREHEAYRIQWIVLLHWREGDLAEEVQLAARNVMRCAR